MPFVCFTCDIQFKSMKELGTHSKKAHLQPPEAKVEEAKETPAWDETPKKPVKLVYRFEGNCEVCGREPDTIIIAAHSMAIAWCPNCKDQLAEKEITPLK